MNLLVASCQESKLAKDIADTFDIPIVRIKTGRFADSESYIDLKDSELLCDAHILLVHQFSSGADASGFSINDQIMHLLFTSDLLKKNKVKKITAILPYLAYSRQNESFDKKFVGPIAILGRFFKDSGIDSVFSCDLHSVEIQKLLSINLEEIKLTNFWSSIIKSNFCDDIDKGNLCIVSPDEGGIERATKLASTLNVPVAFIQKDRISPDTPIFLKLNGKITPSVIVFDDIVSTGKTAIQASQLLKLHGANKLFGVFSHAVFSGGAVSKLVKSEFDKIFVTDTLLMPIDRDNRKNCVCAVSKYIIQYISEALF